MVDTNFYKISKPHTIVEIATATNCEILFPQGNSYNQNTTITAVKPLTLASDGDISFLSNKKYVKDFDNSRATACIVPSDFTTKTELQLVLLKNKNPYLAYTKLIDLFYRSAKTYLQKIATSAQVSALAIIGKNCYIGHNVVIEDNVTIGDDCIIEAGSFIDFGVRIGNRAKIYSHVTLSYCEIGDDVVILPGARIGQDGFGFATAGGVHHKIFHTGKVIIGNNVEIGANTTIDRGSLNDTVIEDLCRIDNLVQIAHNVRIGKGSIIVAQVGVAGSSKIGNYCALGGQVGISGHLTIGDQSQIAAQGGVIQDLPPHSIVGGTPTVPIRDWHKQTIAIKQLTQKRKKNEC